MQTPNLLSSGSSGIGTWIFLSIFFSIILILIIVAVVGSKKDKNEKLVENDKRRKLRIKSESNRIIIFVSLNETIKILEKELKLFKPSVGIRSLGDINKEASTIIKKIISSKELSEVYVSEDFKNELKPILTELNKSKPSTWNKDATFALSLIKAKTKSIIFKKENISDAKLGKTKKWN
ncbi:MAG: hypothetical protein HRS50_02455 [Mycoplasmataceae bacterium]|nr:hypothetical protein [Mycoplasmataceae bacterium]